MTKVKDMPTFDNVGLSVPNNLSQPSRLLRCFEDVGRDVDLPIAFLWKRMHMEQPRGIHPRKLQQSVGGCVHRVNKRLHGTNTQIVPGRMKRTYRLVTCE